MRQRLARRGGERHALLLACCALLLAQPRRQAAAQGLVVSSRTGANEKQAEAFQAFYATAREASESWRRQKWEEKRGSACKDRGTSGRRSGSVCGVDLSSGDSKRALLMAASPPTYDTRIADNNGGFVAAPAPRDQHDCNACVAMAVAAAADAAVSKALNISLTQPLMSSRFLFFCNSAKSSQASDCTSGWDLKPAVDQLTKFARPLPMDACLPFGGRQEMSHIEESALCQPTCNKFMQTGSYAYTKRVPLESIIQIQDHIRRHGAVLTRMRVTPGFVQFYQKPANKHKVWDEDIKPGSSDDRVAYDHAVVLIGYNNPGGYWLVQSSWGKDWGDNGVVKVVYKILEMAVLDSTFGLMFTPEAPPSPYGLSFGRLVNDSSLERGCQWYKVDRTTYLSKVSSDLNVPLESLVANNSNSISDLGAWIRAGEKLKVCGAQPLPPLPPRRPALPPPRRPWPPVSPRGVQSIPPMVYPAPAAPYPGGLDVTQGDYPPVDPSAPSTDIPGWFPPPAAPPPDDDPESQPAEEEYTTITG